MSIENITEDRRKALAVFVALVIVFTWMQLNQPARPVPGAQDSQDKLVESQAVVEKKAPAQIIQNQVDSQPVLADNTPDEPVVSPGLVVDYESAPKLVVDTPNYIARFNLLGGRLESWKLKNHYQTVEKKEGLELINTTGENAPLGIALAKLSDATSLYQLVGSSETEEDSQITISSGEELNLKLQGTLANGLQVNKSLKLNADSYLFDLDVELSQATTDGSKLELAWNDTIPADFSSDRYNLKSVFYKPGDSSVEREVVDGKSHEQVQATGQYVGLGDNYYMSAFVAPAGTAPIQHQTTKSSIGDALISYSLMGDSQRLSSKVYLGPKDPKIFNTIGYDLNLSLIHI